MSLGGHLTELRQRLLKGVLAIVLLGAASLAFARPLFGFLMRPVLAALPEGGRSLIYTSGIEEINVFMKVGLYAGIFLAMPVLLFQLWRFVSPGLYESERKTAAPFVVLGTFAFLLGASFCYLFVLPTMFQFLLRGADGGALETQVEVAREREADAVRLLALGAFELSRHEALAALEALGALPADGGASAPFSSLFSSATDEPKPEDGSGAPLGVTAIRARVEGLQRLVDGAAAADPRLRPALVPAVREAARARTAAHDGELDVARAALASAATSLRRAVGTAEASAVPVDESSPDGAVDDSAPAAPFGEADARGETAAPDAGAGGVDDSAGGGSSASDTEVTRAEASGTAPAIVLAASAEASAPTTVLAASADATLQAAEIAMEPAEVGLEAPLEKAARASPEALPEAPPLAQAVLALDRLGAALAVSHGRAVAASWTKPMLTMREQLSLVLLLELAFGVIFELPLALALLAAAGLVTSSFLFKYQRHAIVLCIVLAAVITPTGDVINLALMSGPMILCYELGVLAAWLVERRRANPGAAPAGFV